MEVPGEISAPVVKTIISDQPDKTEIEAEPTIDARDFFPITVFQKRAAEVDDNSSHPWETARSSFLIENGHGTIAAAETHDASSGLLGILITEKAGKNESHSLFLENLSKAQRGEILDAIHLFTPCLSDELQHQFTRQLIEQASALKDNETTTEQLTGIALKLLPDAPKTGETTNQLSWPKVGGSSPNPIQQRQLSEFIQLVASKLPADTFNQQMEQLHDNLVFTDDPYGKNYSVLFRQMGQWVLNSRQDTQRRYDILERKPPKEYPIKDKITRPIDSQAQLAEVLSALPISEMPDIRQRRRANETAEMVDLNQIVGGTEMKTWSVSTSEGRGLSQIFKLTQKLRTGEVDVVGGDNPIKLVKINNEYYIESDGRHRSAALKALGITQVPAMVTQIN